MGCPLAVMRMVRLSGALSRRGGVLSNSCPVRVGGRKLTPHPNPPPQGGRGKKEGLAEIPSPLEGEGQGGGQRSKRTSMDLRGMVALVTGGNGGLGQRICHALAREGVEIAVVYAQSREPAEAVARDLAARHQIKAAAFPCDVTDGTAVEALIGQVSGYFGRIDILVNDAAYNKAIPFADLDTLTFEIWDKIMDVNLTGPLRLIKAVAPLMKAQRRGRIVNIASVAGLGPTGSSIAYAVSKAGLIQLTRCMAVALAPETLVNCVAPGLLDGTRATANLRPEQVERAAAGALLRKAADKDDCADMVVAMCRSGTMTGQTVVIDSGRLFH